MKSTILLGPILGFEFGDRYTASVLLEKTQPAPTLELSSNLGSIAFKKIAQVGENYFWRAEFTVAVPAKGTFVGYTITIDGKPLRNPFAAKWSFYIPGAAEQPKLLYASCNGFSSAKLASDTEQPYALWERMSRLHTSRKETGPERGPYALLLLGGDQVYADEIWETGLCPRLQEWSHLDEKAQFKATVTPELAREIEGFYNSLYLKRWLQPTMAAMLASIPSVMMWDDHDIFDGWGSYPGERQTCDVYQKIYAEASRVFEIFQLRGSSASRLNAQAGHRSLRLKFRDYHILALDNRSERTMKQIMSAAHWDDVKKYLAALATENVKNLLILSGVPVVYRSFATVEKLFDATPWHEELEDDVQDHWSATSHQAERIKFVMILLKYLEDTRATKPSIPRAVLLSGDVHVGALGQVWDSARKLGLTQIISSGIVHPPPTALAWMGLKLMTSDTPEPLGDGDVVAEMVTPVGSDRYLRTRNFSALHLGTDQKLWVNWICEDADLKPSFAIG